MDRARHQPQQKPTRFPLQLTVAALCLTSFFGGVWVGRSQQQDPPVEEPAPPKMAIEAPVAPAVTPPKTPAGADNLSFFDTLPKGEQPPLGSGINLPPESAEPAEPKIGQALPVAAPVQKTVSTKKEPSLAPAERTGAYLIQAASFTKGEDAQALSARLRSKNHAVFVQTADLGDRGTWYRVMVGPFDSASAAERVVTRLQAEEKLSAMVRRR